MTKENDKWSFLRRKIPDLDQLIRAVPDIREDKVEQIRQKLQQGTYRIEAEKIAEKMMQDHMMDEIYRYFARVKRRKSARSKKSNPPPDSDE